MTFWPLTNSDFPTNQTFHQFHDLDTDFDLHRITSGFHWAFATGNACQQGTLTLPDTWFRPPFWDLLMLHCWDQTPRTCHVFTRLFDLEYPLVVSRFCFVPLKCCWSVPFLNISESLLKLKLYDNLHISPGNLNRHWQIFRYLPYVVN